LRKHKEGKRVIGFVEVMAVFFILTIVALAFNLILIGEFSYKPNPIEPVAVVVVSSPDYSGVGVYDGESCRLYNGYLDYGKVRPLG
jgi:hypothetical protein